MKGGLRAGGDSGTHTGDRLRDPFGGPWAHGPDQIRGFLPGDVINEE